MSENKIINDIENIQTINTNQDNWISTLNTDVQAIKTNHHYYCYGWLSGRTEMTQENTNIQFNNVYGYCWDWNYGGYCVPIKGLYHVDFSFYSNNQQTIDSTAFRACILVDGTQIVMSNSGYGGCTVSGTLLCTQGQRIGLGTYWGWKFSMYGEKGHNYFSIYQVCPIP